MKLRVSEHFEPKYNEEHHITTIASFVDQILSAGGEDFEKIYFEDEITKYDNYQNELYVSQRTNMRTDYYWQDLKRAFPNEFIKTKSDPQQQDWISESSLINMLRDGNKIVILILGDIGCGKTTFIKHFINGEVKKTHICHYYDFNDLAEIANISEKNLQEHLEDDERKVKSKIIELLKLFNKENAFNLHIVNVAKDEAFANFKIDSIFGRPIDNELLSNAINDWKARYPRRYFEELLNFTNKYIQKIVLFFDNIDPLPPMLQEALIRRIIALTDKTEIQTVSTFRLFSSALVINAASRFKNKRIKRLDMPRLANVIKNRMKYFIDNKIESRLYRINWHSDKLSLNISKDTALDILMKYRDIYFTNSSLEKELAILSDLNIRYALDNFLSLMRSSHFGLERDFIAKILENGKVSYKEIGENSAHDILMKAIICAKHPLYIKGESRIDNIYNLYSCPEAKYSILIKYYCITVIYKESVKKHYGISKRDFCSIEDIIHKIHEFGWDREHIIMALQELFEANVLFGYESNTFTYCNKIALSNMGIFYYNTLAAKMYYCYFMLYDVENEENEVKNFFDFEEHESGELVLKLKKDYSGIYDEKLIHGTIMMLLRKIYAEECQLIVEMHRNRKDAPYERYMNQTLTERLCRSFKYHLDRLDKDYAKKLRGEANDLQRSITEILKVQRDINKPR